MKITYLTQSNVIRHLPKGQYAMLRELCQYSNNLYNVGLYNVRQYFFNEKKFLRYEENYHCCKLNKNYKLLQAGIAQQTLKVVNRSFMSFFNLLKKSKSGEYRFQDIKLPHYKKKGGLFPLILSTNAMRISDGYFIMPMSREFTKMHGGKLIKIAFPERLKDKKIKEIRILPIGNGKYFKIQYCYVQDIEKQDVSVDKVLAIDIGLENLVTCVTNIGTSFIVDGRKLKSINQYWNQRKAYFQRITDKQKRKSTNRIFRLTQKRNNQVKDYMNKTARHIVNYCIEHQIGTIVCGYSNLCERYGMLYIEQEESYTSKASCLDMDDIPVFDVNTPYIGTFSGKRIHRGLYQSKNGKRMNADVNGAANILRKSKQNFKFEELCRGLLDSPLRIRIS